MVGAVDDTVSGGPVHSACLAEDVPVSLDLVFCLESGTREWRTQCAPLATDGPEPWRANLQRTEEPAPSSPTIEIKTGPDDNNYGGLNYPLDLTIDCAKQDGPCMMRHRIELGVDDTWSRRPDSRAHMHLHRLHFVNLWANVPKHRGTEVNGGAIAVLSGNSLDAVSCVFTGNSASGNGGAIFAGGSAILTVVASVFRGNGAGCNSCTSAAGGAIAISAMQSSELMRGDTPVRLIVSSCIFERNGWVARSDGHVSTPWELVRNGGAIYASSATVSITSSVFRFNFADSHLTISNANDFQDPECFAMNTSTFATNFTQNCVDTSAEFAGQTDVCMRWDSPMSRRLGASAIGSMSHRFEHTDVRELPSVSDLPCHRVGDHLVVLFERHHYPDARTNWPPKRALPPRSGMLRATRTPLPS